MLKVKQIDQLPLFKEDFEYNTIEFIEKEEKILSSPKKSKISNKLSKTLEKSISKEIDSNETKTTSHTCDGNNETHIMLFITVNLIVNNLVKSSSLIMNSSSTIEFLIEKAIDNFNAEFVKEKVLFKLKSDPKLYSLKQTKKNGFPKIDMPNFHLKTSIGNTKQIQFSLVWNEDPGNYKDYFIIKKVEEKESKCKECIIF